MEDDLKTQLMYDFEIYSDATYFVRGVQLPNGAKEVITTSENGIESQKQYIEKAYNSKLELIANPSIKIKSWFFV